MEEEIKRGRYRHFKGNTYQVLGTALHSETLEELVVYQAEYQNDRFPDGQLWVRPKAIFLEKAPLDERNITKQEERFQYIGELK